MKAEILGVRLLANRDEEGRSTGPINVVEVPLTRGVTCLAGLNGAGKTRVLEAIAAALGGKPWSGGSWHVLVRLADGPSELPALESAICDHLNPWSGVFDLPPDFETNPGAVDEAMTASETAYAEDRQRNWRTWIQARVLDGLTNATNCAVTDPAAVAAALAEQATFCLTHADQKVQVAVAVDRRTEHPALLTQIDDDWTASIADLSSATAELVTGTTGIVFEPLGSFSGEWYLEGDPATRGWVSPFAADTLPRPLHDLPNAHWRQPGWPIVTFDVDHSSDVSDMTQAWLAQLLGSEEDALTVMSLQEEEADYSDVQAWAASTARLDAHLALIERREKLPSSPVVAMDVLTMIASRTYAALTGQTLPLHCRLHPVSTWLGPGHAFTWLAIEPATGKALSVESLSHSQRRWARFAIAAALHRTPARPLAARDGSEWTPWLFIDEPESGVHRAAEARLATGLQGLVRDLGVSVVLATHSPHMVREADAIRLVKRGPNGQVLIENLPPDAAAVATDLGLEVTDLLGWYRQILFVEGAHDEAVVNVLLGEEIEQTRTLVIPIRGVKDAGTVVTARLLDFTDATVLMLVDGLGADAARSWESIKGLAGKGDLPAARRRADAAYDGRGHESRFLRECASLLLRQAGAIERFSIQALQVGDVIELLPATEVLAADLTWEAVRARFAVDRPKDNFKDWLVRTYRCPPIGVNRVRKIAKSMQSLPTDIQTLADNLTAGHAPHVPMTP